MPKQRSSFLNKARDTILAYLKLPFVDFGTIYRNFRDPELRKQVWTKVWIFLKLLFERITTEGVLKESSSLTYITTLGFIPFITFIVMIVPDLPFLDVKAKLNEIIVANFMPGSADAVSGFVSGMLKQRTGFNIFSFIVLTVTSYSLFRTIRNTFDRILGMEFRATQDIFTQLIKFFGTLIFGLLIMILLFSSSSLPIVTRLLKYSFFKQQLLNILPFLAQFLALIFLYMLLPSIRVKRGSLFRGAFWTTLVWVIAKSGFDWYIYNLTSVQAVYGYIAILPITLMWIYLNWVIIMGGIVLISVIDQKDNLRFVKKTPQKVIRITLEMFTDKKLNNRIEDYLTKTDLKGLAEIIEDKVVQEEVIVQERFSDNRRTLQDEEIE
ncbi:MAG TPA: YihY family inner membrane protein [Candidatus Cloacimonadota bacterium]|nr:YihY family inner membrane protein [Candidatus Cloacimonadota bacterium]